MDNSKGAGGGKVTPEQERRLVDLLARTVALVAGLVADTRDLAVAAGRSDPEKASRLARDLYDLSEEAAPLIDAAEGLLQEFRDGK